MITVQEGCDEPAYFLILAHQTQEPDQLEQDPLYDAAGELRDLK
ncbi:hypothetical protein [Kribbella sp. CA-294648]